jgi:hypothetical protein
VLVLRECTVHTPQITVNENEGPSPKISVVDPRRCRCGFGILDPVFYLNADPDSGS